MGNAPQKSESKYSSSRKSASEDNLSLEAFNSLKSKKELKLIETRHTKKRKESEDLKELTKTINVNRAAKRARIASLKSKSKLEPGMTVTKSGRIGGKKPSRYKDFDMTRTRTDIPIVTHTAAVGVDGTGGSGSESGSGSGSGETDMDTRPITMADAKKMLQTDDIVEELDREDEANYISDDGENKTQECVDILSIPDTDEKALIASFKMIGLNPAFYPKPHQLEGTRFIIDGEVNYKGSVLSDEMGLGKTLQMNLVRCYSQLRERGSVNKQNSDPIFQQGLNVKQRQQTLILTPLAVSDQCVIESLKYFLPKFRPRIAQYKGTGKWLLYLKGSTQPKDVIMTKEMTKERLSRMDLIITHHDALSTLYQKFIKKRNQTTYVDDFDLGNGNKSAGGGGAAAGSFSAPMIVPISSYDDLFSSPTHSDTSGEKEIKKENEIDDFKETLGDVELEELEKEMLLLTFKYKRVIVDEAHKMRNFATWLAKACCALDADVRLCVTGTPKINFDSDTWSLFNFLRIPGLVTFKEYKKLIVCSSYLNKLKRATNESGQIVLDPSDISSIGGSGSGSGGGSGSIGSTGSGSEQEKENENEKKETEEQVNYIEILYKRHLHCVTKLDIREQDLQQALQFQAENPGTELPDWCVPTVYPGETMIIPPSRTLPVGAYQKEIIISSGPAFKAMYDIIVVKQREEIDEMMQMDAQDTILAQALAEEFSLPPGKKSSQRSKKKQLEKKEKKAKAKREKKEKSGISRETNAAILSSFIYLRQLTVSPKTLLNNIDHQLKFTNMCGPAIIQKAIEEDEHIKIGSILNYVEHDMQPEDRCLIFCEFVAGCHNIAEALRSIGERVVVVTGNTDSNTKAQVIKSFQLPSLEPNEPRFMISTFCMHIGITLIGANHVLFPTPWWHDNEERQAWQRTHRFGQLKDVHYAYFLVNDTIDMRIREVSKSKKGIPSTRQLMRLL